jgi:WbqC-like protein family
MKVGIMQPYLFPYIGYFQLIHAVDAFVIHDDVQYIKGGWINRNRIQINDKDYLFTFSLKKDSSLDNINLRFFSDQFQKEKLHFFKIIQNSYNKAPFYRDVYDLLQTIFSCQEDNISIFIANSLQLICNYLKILTPFYISSELKKDNNLRNQDRVINICRALNAKTYINPIGGIKLYTKEVFKKHAISLFFLRSKKFFYKTDKKVFIPDLSIIDIMMFNSKEKIVKMLDLYTLI